MEMADAIEMVMLSIAALMVIFCGAKPEKVAHGSVFQAGMQAVIAIFGVAWMGDTFFRANQAAVQGPLTGHGPGRALDLRHRPLRHVDPALQPGRHRPHAHAARDLRGHARLGARRACSPP